MVRGHPKAEKKTTNGANLGFEQKLLRSVLLPKLISGELRVKDAEHIVGKCI